MLAWKVYFRRGIDVIQGCNPPDLIFLVALPFKLLGARYIFDHHDITPETFEAKYQKKGFFWRLMHVLERLTFLCADVTIATNESYARVAVERGRMAPDRVFVVRSGPEPDLLRYLVGYVGVMGEQESIDVLIAAAEHLVRVKGRDDIQFCLVGGGPSLEDMKALTARKGLDDYIHFTGRAPDETLFEVLSTADVGVDPGRVNAMTDKSTMNKILEYMAFGKPIVQFEVTEGRYSAGEASLYARNNDPVDLADKIAELLDDPDRRAAMGAFGRKRVETELGWAQQVEPLLAAYRRALDRRR